MLKNIYYQLHRLLAKPQERGEYSSGVWQDAIRKEALDLCRQIKGRILEIGCGEGLFLAQLAQSKPELELWGIDNSSARIEQADLRLSKLGMQNFHLAVEDAAGLSFTDGFFDAVVCINVFFNLPSEELVKKTLGEMKRVCKRRGSIIFDFRNAANFFLQLKYWLAPWYDETVKDLPLKTYFLSEMEKLAGDSGLRIIKKSFLGASWKKFAPIIVIQAERS